jgi:hypothetical protein
MDEKSIFPALVPTMREIHAGAKEKKNGGAYF